MFGARLVCSRTLSNMPGFHRLDPLADPRGATSKNVCRGPRGLLDEDGDGDAGKPCRQCTDSEAGAAEGRQEVLLKTQVP